VLVDAIAWHEADEQLLELLPSHNQGTQLLIRAAIFRLLSDSDATADRYDVLVNRLKDRVRPA
jgi:hypothetical protein